MRRRATPRETALQRHTVRLLVELDEAERELGPRRYATLLDIVASRIAADIVRHALGEAGQAA